MDGLLREGEQVLEGQMGGNSNTQTNTGKDQGNVGGGDNQQQSGGNQSSGGGFMGGLERTGEDAMINQEINQFANKEGLPPAMDGVVDGFVDQELSQFQK